MRVKRKAACILSEKPLVIRARRTYLCSGMLALVGCAGVSGSPPVGAMMSADAATERDAPVALEGGGTYHHGVYTCCGPGQGVSCCTADAGLLGYASDGAVSGDTSGRTEANCFQYGGGAGSCYDNGAMFDGKDSCALCCAGLRPVKPLGPNRSYPDGPCILTSAISAFVCLPCGNGICDSYENSCSCPEDCG